MDGIHRLLAYGTVVGAVIGIGWSALLILSRRPAGPGFDRLQAVVVAALIVGAASGLPMFVSGARPADGLHLLYAVVAIALVPLARTFGRGAAGRGPVAFLLVAFAVLAAVLYRLFTTG